VGEKRKRLLYIGAKSNTSLKVKIWKIVGVGAGEDEWFSLKASTVRKPLFS